MILSMLFFFSSFFWFSLSSHLCFTINLFLHTRDNNASDVTLPVICWASQNRAHVINNNSLSEQVWVYTVPSNDSRLQRTFGLTSHHRGLALSASPWFQKPDRQYKYIMESAIFTKMMLIQIQLRTQTGAEIWYRSFPNFSTGFCAQLDLDKHHLCEYRRFHNILVLAVGLLEPWRS